MAKRVRRNFFKANRYYFILTATKRMPGNPNVYMETWTVNETWTTNVTFLNEPRVFYTKLEAETAALALAARFPDKIGRMEVVEYSRSQNFEQIAGL
jgi:hypothetical protein